MIVLLMGLLMCMLLGCTSAVVRLFFLIFIFNVLFITHYPSNPIPASQHSSIQASPLVDEWQETFLTSMHLSDGSYEKIAQRFFATLNYDTFFPRVRRPALGRLRAPSLPASWRRPRSLHRASQGRSVDEVMANIGVSPQCGFASVTVGADGMTEDKMFCQAEAGE